MSEKLHVYCFGYCEWLVGTSSEHAALAAREEIGWEAQPDDEPPVQEPDDACMGIWLDEATGSPSDSGLFVWGDMETWAEAYGPGFLCSTEY